MFMLTVHDPTGRLLVVGDAATDNLVAKRGAGHDPLATFEDARVSERALV
jgi:hypothetical protein